MKKIPVLAAVMILFIVLPAWSAGAGVSGNWEASVMGSKIKAQVQQEGQSIQGVAHVYTLLGTKDTYHFTGNVHKGKVSAGHYSGHVFSGNLTREGRLVGVLKTKGGKRISVSAVRK